jgi:predicted transcriptional regulator
MPAHKVKPENQLRVTSVRMQPSVERSLQRLARKEGITRSALIRRGAGVVLHEARKAAEADKKNLKRKASSR